MLSLGLCYGGTIKIMACRGDQYRDRKQKISARIWIGPGGEIRRGFSRARWGHRGGLDNGPLGLKQEFLGQEQIQVQPLGIANNNKSSQASALYPGSPIFYFFSFVRNAHCGDVRETLAGSADLDLRGADE